MIALACTELARRYGDGESAEWAVRGVSLALRAGEACVLLGPSGSGKTTLLSMIGCLLTPTAGGLEIGGRAVDFGKSGGLAGIRRRDIGFVFQHAQLLPFLTARQNLDVVAANAGSGGGIISELMEVLGLARLAHKRPGELSGGQRQRFAIARALLHSPRLVLADEPTAALDWENASAALDLLVEQTRARGAALLVVTHDRRLIPRFDRVYEMEDGRIMVKEPGS